MDHQTDIAVVGGGIMGVASAYYLAQNGLAVTLIDRGEIGGGASYGNAGLLVPGHSVPLAQPGVLAQGLQWMLQPESPFYVKPRPDAELMRWLWRFRSFCNEDHVRRAIPLLRDMQRLNIALCRNAVAQERLDCHFREQGGLMLYRTPEGLAKGRRELELLTQYGLRIEEWDAPTLRDRLPLLHPQIAGGLNLVEDGHLDPARFVDTLANHCAALGVVLMPNTPVTDFVQEDHGIRALATENGEVRAREIVLAAGAWSSELARRLDVRLPMQPAKGYSLTGPSPAELGDVPLHFGEARVVATPLGSRLRLAGTMELAGFDPQINRRRVEAIRRAASLYLKGMESWQPEETWQGYRPLPPDGLPYLGRTGKVRNLIVATGHSYLGMSMGMVTGKLVAQMVTGESPLIDLAPMGVDRFA